ncbi:MAG: padC2 [Dehalococcoidia bacterium]|nr:padC2 [Dehalococcoidia bacterium]
MAKLGMVIDLKRCVGCYGCVTSCKAENGTPPRVFWSRVLEREEGKYPSARRLFVPVLCNHCAEPACETACPTHATYRTEDGIVRIDENKCIGCRACMAACPYGARFYLKEARQYYTQEATPFEKLLYKKHQIGTVQKCEFCYERTQKGLEPACVLTCITRARTFGDLDDPDSEVSRLLKQRYAFKLRPEMGTEPKVIYLS